jgi:signal recognition particle subunit SRP54
MMPGMGKTMKQLREVNMDERELDRLEAIILSMTPPSGPARTDRRLAAQADRAGSGPRQAVNQLVKQFGQMRKMMAQLAKGKMPDPSSCLGACGDACGSRSS